MASSNRKTVLLMTVAVAGQSNSILTLALELLTHQNVDVHVASFQILRKRAEKLSAAPVVVGGKHPGSSFTFHAIDGMNLGEAIMSKGLAGVVTFSHPPMAKNRDDGMNKLTTLGAIWNGKGEPIFSSLAQVSRENGSRRPQNTSD